MNESNKIAIVTGANVGLGYETILSLAAASYTVVMACRNIEKANRAKQQILQKVPLASLVIMQIDTSKLAICKAICKPVCSTVSTVGFIGK